MEPDEYRKQINEILAAFKDAIDALKEQKVDTQKLEALERAQQLLGNLAEPGERAEPVPGKFIALADAKAARTAFIEKFGGPGLPDLPPLFRFNKIRANAVLLRTLLAPDGIESISCYLGYDKGADAIKLLLVPEDKLDRPVPGATADQDVLDEMRPCPPPGCNDLV